MLINLRNALMAGKRLPYDNEIEFLGMTGGQYINTGIVGSSATKVEITAYSTNTTNTMSLFGARDATDRRPSYAIWQRSTTSDMRMRFDYNTATSDSLVNSNVNAWNTNEANTVVKDGARNYVNGTENPSNQTNTFQLPCPFYLGTVNDSNSPASFYFVGHIYSCKIWDANGALVRDFIPVRKGTVGYLYDRVSGKLFGNEGSGDFVLGPDVVPVEYIESHGTEWIDTGVYLTGNHSVEIDFRLTAISQSRKGLFGGLSTSRYGALLSPSNSKLEFGYGSGNTFYQITPDALRHSAKQQENLLYVDGVLIHTFNEATFTSNFSAPLGNFNYTNYTPAQAKYYLSKWHDGDTLIRSFRPVRVGTEGAMMDVLTRRIYRNAGTGAFGYGNDLKYPIPAS